ncbi:LOW QUALITY PROTEIN: myoferlin [Anomaloglossus baeobatrachus]
MLKVFVDSASNVPKTKLGKPDPIVTITFRGEKKKTKSIDNELNPVWKELLEFDLKGIPIDYSSTLEIVVKDFETIGKDKLIGSTTISLKDFAAGAGRSIPFRGLALMSEKGQPIGATIDLSVSYEPPVTPTSNVTDPGGTNVQPDTENEDEEDGDVVDSGFSPFMPGVPGQTENQIARRLTKGKKTRRLLSNKPQDFQIRVRVIEGRQLSGNNIKPVVKVSVAGQTHRTRIKRGNNPYFDEIFFYNVNMSPSELLDESVILRLFNSGSIRADSLIGEFKLDIGFIYDEPSHAIMRKWVLLHDPEDTSSGAKGYLKVSMFIIGTGDEPPAEKREKDIDSDDVESNLLLPTGVALRWVTFLLKIYRAEDIPQMDDAFAQSVKQIFGGDSDKKNLVDPFVEVSFAGKKVSTKIIEKNANPEWNQAVNLQIKFPSVCEHIRLTVYDWDRLTKNDAVGTTILSLSKIAASGGDLEDSETSGVGSSALEAAGNDKEVGFLPTFGPCYLNLYGSPREFTGFPDPFDDLNFGKGEGVAYRGRILVELTTKLDGTPAKKIEDIPSDDILVVEKYQRRRKFSLCAVFHSATMLQDIGEAIQFEVSIGNYGNKFDSTCKPLASTTQYSRAVFDGNLYYYLPWSATKPVVTLLSYWEDICHRLDVVNMLQAMMERLQSNISALKSAIQAKIPDARLAEIWLKLIDQLIEDTMRPLPSLEGKSHVTVLDMQLYKLRQTSLKLIGEAAVRMRSEATDVKSTLPEIEDWLEKLQQVSEEPQNSMPDVIIWMIRAEKRLAYARVPAHQVLFSSVSEGACGKYCGKKQTIYLQYPMDKNKGAKIPVQLRVSIWLGLSAVEKKFNSYAEGTFSVNAEMYENQALMFGKWGTTGLLKRPKFSDVTGTIKLKQESFLPPKGWEWEGDWIVDPERSLLTEADAGHSEFTDEVFQNESRYPGAEWKQSDEPYTDVNGEKSRSPGEFECPHGWVWEDDAWIYDINRAVDEKDSPIGNNVQSAGCQVPPYLILTWGLRNMKSYQMASVTSPSLIVECGGEIVQSAVIKNLKKTPNFLSSILFMKVLLPKEEMYVPPIIIKVIDPPFGRKPVVGQCTIDTIEHFRCDPYAARMDGAAELKVALLASSPPRDVVIDVEDTKPLLASQQQDKWDLFHLKKGRPEKLQEKEEEIVDWWSKYYTSIGEHEKCGQYLQKGYDSLKVYDCELEDAVEFSGLIDFCETFKLFRGKSEDDDDPSVVGEFKGSFRIYPLPDDPSIQAPPRQFRELPDSGPQECIVRIYIIRGIDLQPKDNNGLCDPYIKITLSRKVIEDRDNYMPNTLNPVFGRMYELSCFLPQEKDLKISVYDYDALTRDEKVGETIIDLENRFLSRFGSHCGLPQTYCVSGINQWRDQLKPTEILQNIARFKSVPPPVYSDNGTKASFAGRDYSLEDCEANKKMHQHLGSANERLALYVLRGQGLVPEHVETRTLYSTFQPNLSQGKLEMWVDVFPKSLGPPGPPFNIAPRKAKNYVLRVVVWNTKDVLLDEKSITGEEMSDIYVKGWIPGNEENKQKTDVHYRSLDGDGNFNWRFVFPFEYLPAEQLCIISKKEHFWSLDKTEFKLPPKLLLQIWDNDKFSLDDYLGFVELDLHRTIMPSKTPEKCSLDMTSLMKPAKVASLFEQKSMKGWWPCYAEKDGKRILAGKIELTLEVLNEKDAEERPAGKGRDEPNMNPKLDPPNRPETSFLWFTNPCKTMKFIVWRKLKWYFIGFIILALLLLFLAVFLYSLPGYVSMKIVRPNN